MRNKMVLFYVITICVYLLIVGITIFVIDMLNDSLRFGHSAGYVAILFGPIVCAVCCVIWFIVSLFYSHSLLDNRWHSVAAFAGTIVLIWLIVNISQAVNAYIHYNKIVPYADYYEAENDDRYGPIREEGRKNGKGKQGLVTFYYRDGSIEKTEMMKNGYVNGECCEYYANGKLKEKGLRTCGQSRRGRLWMRQGEWTFYREDGTLDDVRTYKDGIITKSKNYKLYAVKGNLDTKNESETVKLIIYDIQMQTPYTGRMDKTPIIAQLDDDDEILFGDDKIYIRYYTGNAINGKFDGEWQIFYDKEGLKLTEKGVGNEGRLNGEYVSYYENGQVLSQYTAVDDKCEGEYISYYKNGQIECQCQYSNGKHNGEFATFYQDSTANPHGQRRHLCTYKNDQRDGLAQWWYENGQLKTKTVYVNGEEQTMEREEYDEQGNSTMCVISVDAP